MPRYMLIEGGVAVNAIAIEDPQQFPSWTLVQSDTAHIGDLYSGGTFVTPEPPPAAPSPTDWLIDVGPFFDRFAAAKMPLLMSTNATVQALVKDLQVRKWIDLQRADVGAGIDALIALGVPGMTTELKTAILTTPPTAEENFALKKVYFS